MLNFNVHITPAPKINIHDGMKQGLVSQFTFKFSAAIELRRAILLTGHELKFQQQSYFYTIV
jgi:hypothetical protein